MLWIGAASLAWPHVVLWLAVVFTLPVIYFVAVAVRGSWTLSRRESRADFLVVLRRISGRHLKYHMLYPLAIGALLEFAFIFWSQPVWWSWDAVWKTLLEMGRLQHIVPVLGVVLTYLVLLYRFVIKATVIPYNPMNLSTVRDYLREATGYFALSPIRLKDWFKPNSVRYFSMLLENKTRAEQENRNFDYQRVVVFARDRDYHDALTQVLDRPYSWALSRFHGDFEIPLAYIKQHELASVLDRVEPKGRPTLLGSTAWPQWMIKRFNLHRRKPWIFHLDFALIYSPNGNIVIVAPIQKEDAIVINDDRVRIYEQLVDEIRKATHDKQGRVRHDHDFVELISER